MKEQSRKMLELLNKKEMKLGTEQAPQSYDLSKLDSQRAIQLSNVFSANNVKSSDPDSEEAQLAENIKVAVDMVTHAQVGDYSIDITPLKFATFNAQSTGVVTASIRLTAVEDTRSNKGTGITARDGSDKLKAVPQVAVSVTGLSVAAIKALDKLAKISRLITNRMMYKSYVRMGSGGKTAYINNLKYRKAKEMIYQDRVRGESDDLAARQSDLNSIVSYIDVGEASLDLSMAGFYSTPNLSASSDFGNVFENDLGLKHIKETKISDTLSLYSRTIPDLMNPAKANYHESLSSEVKDITESLQIIQIAVLTMIAYEEISYLNLGDPKINQEEIMTNLDQILESLEADKETSITELEESLGVTEQEKVEAIQSISPAIKEINDQRIAKKLTGLE